MQAWVAVQEVALEKAGWAEEVLAHQGNVYVLSAGHEPPINRVFHVLNKNVQIVIPLW